jgi:hypothetical protein
MPTPKTYTTDLRARSRCRIKRRGRISPWSGRVDLSARYAGTGTQAGEMHQSVNRVTFAVSPGDFPRGRPAAKRCRPVSAECSDRAFSYSSRGPSPRTPRCGDSRSAGGTLSPGGPRSESPAATRADPTGPIPDAPAPHARRSWPPTHGSAGRARHHPARILMNSAPHTTGTRPQTTKIGRPPPAARHAPPAARHAPPAAHHPPPPATRRRPPATRRPPRAAACRSPPAGRHAPPTPSAAIRSPSTAAARPILMSSAPHATANRQESSGAAGDGRRTDSQGRDRAGCWAGCRLGGDYC